jgi:hypothetical protein
MHPTDKSPSVTQNIETYTLNPHVIPHKSCANVLVSEQIKHVNSQLPKVSNKLQILSSDHVFKLLSSLMKSNHKFLGQPKFKDNINMHFFFLKNKTSVCKCVSHTPKLESYIVPNVCIELKNEVKGIGYLSEQMWVYHTPKLVSKNTCPEKN